MSDAHPFGDLPRDARGHLMLHFNQAVLAFVCYARARSIAAAQPADTILEQHPFLRTYVDAMLAHAGTADCDAALDWLRDVIAAWERTVTDPLPLRALRRDLGLSADHLLGLLLVGVLEEDPRFGAVFAAAQDGATRRPSIALVFGVVAAAGAGHAPADAWSFCRTLVDAGLADVLNPGDARAEWQLRVPVPLWTALCGECPARPLPAAQWHAPAELTALHELVADPAHVDQLREARVLLASGAADALIIRGLSGSLRVELVGSVARSLGLGLLEITPADAAIPETMKLAGALATLLGAIPLFVLELGPGELFRVPDWRGYHGPVAIVLGPDGGVAGAVAERGISLHLGPEPVSLRTRYWQRAFPRADAAVHDTLARRYTLGGAYVHRAADLAAAHASLDGRTAVTAQDVQVAARSINRQQLDSLAARLESSGGWDRLVLHPATAQELLHLERRCRFRERLTDSLAGDIPGGLDRGVKALFQGPSGTGKTLAARVLAAELGLDIYRVDLSAIVSKYIGETEKNLSRVLARAEDLDVILLLDEGDSLLGRRTQVRSSNDRWANLETNYLLQRLDGYTGIVFVTTNAPGSIDAAFQRRMDAVVRFHMPSAEERWSLWQQHLPSDHCVDADELQHAALRYELTGGQIRNAAIDAALLGFASADGRLRTSDFTAAINAEYRRSGASTPRPRALPETTRAEAMSSFLGSIQ